MNTKTLIAIVLLLCSLQPAVSAEKMMIAVLDFEGRGASKAVAADVSGLIRTEMVNSGRYMVTEKSQMDAALKEHGFKTKGCTDVTCAVEIGKILGVKKVLLGTVKKKGKKIIINGSIVDVEKAAAEYTEKAAAGSKDKLNAAVSEISEKIMSRMDPSVEEMENSEADETTEDEPAVEEEAVKYGGANHYEGLTTAALYMSGACLLGGTYMNVMIRDLNNEISDLEKKYNAAGTTAEATRINNDIESREDKVKSYRLYRNIFFGTGGVFAIATGYFAYKFANFNNQLAESSGNFTAPLIMPVCWYNPFNNRSREDVYYLGAGLTANF